MCVFWFLSVSSSQWLPTLRIHLFIIYFLPQITWFSAAAWWTCFLPRCTLGRNIKTCLFPSHFIPFVSSPVSCLCTTHKLPLYLPNSSLFSQMADQHREKWKKTQGSLIGRNQWVHLPSLHLGFFFWFCLHKSSTQIKTMEMDHYLAWNAFSHGYMSIHTLIYVFIPRYIQHLTKFQSLFYGSCWLS